MSEDTHIDGHNQEVEFEREDLTPKPIFIFLITLTAVCVLVYFILRGMYSFLDAQENRHQPPQNPLVPQTQADTRLVAPSEITKFPQPRLETNERLEINDFRLQEERTLHSYGWVDQQAGVVHIPIDRAIQLLVQRGLPVRPQAGAAAQSGVNPASDAARKADGKPKRNGQ